MRRFRFIVPVLMSVLCVQILSAQNNYFTHKLKEGETLSALAKQYNTNVGDIMRLNGMHADTKLVYGSTIRIPAAEVQTAKQQKSTVQQPKPEVQQKPQPVSTDAVTHRVAQGETLYSISKRYNVPAEQIKAWNHLPDNSVKLDMDLIVGTKQSNTVVSSSQKQSPKVEEKASASVVTETQSKPEVDVSESKTADVSQPNVETSKSQNTNAVNLPTADAASMNEHGYFADQFEAPKKKRLHSTSGMCKTFKTASGWNDGKYYILANDIDPGTIVRVTADNGKSVYAKVLWNMGGLKENAGLDFRISNAAAAALQENDTSFNLHVAY